MWTDSGSKKTHLSISAIISMAFQCVVLVLNWGPGPAGIVSSDIPQATQSISSQQW